MEAANALAAGKALDHSLHARYLKAKLTENPTSNPPIFEQQPN